MRISEFFISTLTLLWLRFTVLSNFIFLLDLQYTGIDSLSLFSILLDKVIASIACFRNDTVVF